MPLTEADTCRKFVVPMLQAAGWDTEPHSIAEQRTITDGRIVPVRQGFIRKPPRRVDYLLRFERNFPLAVVEATRYSKACPAKCAAMMRNRWQPSRLGAVEAGKKSTMEQRPSFRLEEPKRRRKPLRAT